jgi:Cof subfamily protein (haloacid dehalogenase superfamily)
MKNYQLIVFDLDGTLLTQEFELLPSTIDAISELRRSGLRVTVATGRSYKSAKPFLDQLDIVEPMIFSNGSVFDNPDTGERELITGIPLEAALIVLMLLPEFNISVKLHMADGSIFKSDDTPWPDEGTHFEVGEIRPRLKAELDEDPIKIVFYDETGNIDAFSKKLNEILDRKSQVRLFRSHVRYMEMTNKNVSKGQTLKKLVSQLGIPPADVITVGDQDNDLEMIRDFGLGVVAGPGTPSLLKVCDHRIPMPEAQGIENLKDWLTGST